MPVKDLITTIENRPEVQAREAAAILIQRTWRGRKDTTRMKEEYLNDGQRWEDAVADARMEVRAPIPFSPILPFFPSSLPLPPTYVACTGTPSEHRMTSSQTGSPTRSS
jgi:hypothetical protein